MHGKLTYDTAAEGEKVCVCVCEEREIDAWEIVLKLDKHVIITLIAYHKL